MHNAQNFADESTSRSKYAEKDKELIKCTRTDKRAYIDNQAQLTEVT